MLQQVTMKLTFLFLVFFSNVHPSHQDNQVDDFKKQLQRFSAASKETEQKLQEWRDGATRICITSKLSQISVDDESSKVALRFIKNTGILEFLEAVYAFTNNRLILTPRIHRKLLQDKHTAKHIIKNYKRIHGVVQRYVKYDLMEQDCHHLGSVDLSKMIIQVYKNFQGLVRLMQ